MISLHRQTATICSYRCVKRELLEDMLQPLNGRRNEVKTWESLQSGDCCESAPWEPEAEDTVLVQQLPSDSLQRERDTWGCTKASSVPIITSEAGECGAILSSAKAVSITINYQVLINKSWFVRLINSINNSDTRLMQLGSMKNAVPVRLPLTERCIWYCLYSGVEWTGVEWCKSARCTRCPILVISGLQLFVHISCSTVNTTHFCCFRLLPPCIAHHATHLSPRHATLSTDTSSTSLLLLSPHPLDRVRDPSMCNCNYNNGRDYL